MKIEGTLAFEVVDRSDERVVAEMPVAPGMKNPYGVVHAGAILWFADVVATLLVMGPGRDGGEGAGFPLAVTLNANFAGNQKEGVFRAEARFVKKGKTISVVRTSVTGENGRLIADVTTNHVAAR